MGGTIGLLDAPGSPEGRADQRYLPLAALRLQRPPRMLCEVDVGGVVLENDIVDVKPAASDNLMPVSAMRATSHLASSSSTLQSCCMRLMFSSGMGLRLLLSSRSGRYTREKAFRQSRPCSWMHRLMMERIVEKLRFTELVVSPLARR